MSMSYAMPMSHATGSFVQLLFSAFERAAIRYCVLHGWEELPEKVSSDLDLVIHPEDLAKLQVVFSELAKVGYKWIQCRNYAGRSYRFDFAWFEGKKLRVVGVDCISEYRYAGLILRSGEDLLKDRRQHNGFWIASAEAVFAYMLTKKSLKAEISAGQLQELQQVSAEIGIGRSLAIASDLFGVESGALVVAAIADRTLPAMLPKLCGQLKRTILKRHPWSFVRSQADEQMRLVKRWFQPTGLFLIALGPDGAGKSTVLAKVVENLKPAFRGIHSFHYRAKFGVTSNVPVTNPHAKPPRGPILSVIRVLLLFFQFWFSYLVLVRPKLGRSGLVIFDRYFHDLLVDHRRYRYSGPQWLLQLLLKLSPGTGLVLILDADESVIYSRKQEVSVELLKELRRGYKQLALNKTNAAVICSDQDIEDTTMAATEVVYQYLLARCNLRYPQWTQGYEANPVTKVVSLGRAS